MQNDMPKFLTGGPLWNRDFTSPQRQPHQQFLLSSSSVREKKLRRFHFKTIPCKLFKAPERSATKLRVPGQCCDPAKPLRKFLVVRNSYVGCKEP